MSLKILYIHGFGSTGNSQTVQGLQKILGNDATILAPQFSNDLSTVAQIEQNIAEAKKYMREFRPNVVIGSSFGGFIATFLNGYARILINPCLLPSERLSTLSPTMSDEDIKRLKVLETSHDIDHEICFEMYGLFGLHDELFSYLPLYKKLYGESQTYSMPCGHRIDAENIENHLIPIIWEVKKNLDSLTPEMFDDYWPDDICGEFINDFVKVCINGKFGFVNKMGELVVQVIYDSAEDFTKVGKAKVRIDGKCGFVNQMGELTIE